MVTNAQSQSRDREQTRKSLLEAVDRLLTREGVPAVRVNAVAREAGVDKVLIYRYFGGFEGLCEAYAAESDFWWTPDELVGDELDGPDADTPAGWARLVFARYADALRKRPATLAVLAAEPSFRTPLVVALEEIRERRSAELADRLARRMTAPATLDIPALSMIVASALHYILIRSLRIKRMNGVGIVSDEDWERLQRAIDHLVTRSFSAD